MNWLKKLLFGELTMKRYIIESKDEETYQTTILKDIVFEKAHDGLVRIYEITDSEIFKFDPETGMFKPVEKQ